MSRILRYLVCLFMLIFAGNALAAGYSCPSYKKYTSCAEGYYISYCGTGDNADWWEYFNKNGGVPTTDLAPGNSCVACPTSSVSSPGVKYVCAGGLMCPENVGILVSCDLNGGSLPPGMALANLTCTKGVHLDSWHWHTSCRLCNGGVELEQKCHRGRFHHNIRRS